MRYFGLYDIFVSTGEGVRAGERGRKEKEKGGRRRKEQRNERIKEQRKNYF